MTILAFIPVENACNWGREDIENLDDKKAFVLLWKNKDKGEVDFVNMDSECGTDDELDQVMFKSSEFESKYNDEDYDGGWWCKVMHLDREFVIEKVGLRYRDIKRVACSDSDEIFLVSKKFFGDGEEHSALILCEDGKAVGDGITLTFPRLSELTDAQIREIDIYTGGRITDSGCITPWDVCVKYGRIVSFGIMNTYQGHDADLVRRINVAWMERKEDFRPILCALYEQQIDEITDADSFQIDSWQQWPENAYGLETGDWTAYNKLALDTMKEKWDEYAENYLMHVADGKDLQCILDFVRG